MTTTTIATSSSAPAGHFDQRPSRALAVRRGFLIASPVIAGLLAVLGAAADPAAGISGEAMWRIYSDQPEPLQFKSLGYHWSYAFWIAPALLMAGYVRGRGAWLANIAAFLAFTGMTTLPGMLLTDWYDSAIGQLYGIEGTVAVQERMTETMWGVPVMVLPGLVGFVLALPLATIAMWRAGLMRWWALAAVVGGFAAFSLSNATWWGACITTGFFAVFAVALARATRPSAV